MSTLRQVIALLLFICLLTSCRTQTALKPDISFIPPSNLVEDLPSAFPELSVTERGSDWGKELYIGQKLGRDLDLFRAITAFKRAKILADDGSLSRRTQINYSIALAYYLGGKYDQVTRLFEKGDLLVNKNEFPAFNEACLIVYDSYFRKGDENRAKAILESIQKSSPEIATKLTLYHELATGHIQDPLLCSIQQQFAKCCKSPQKAQFFNAILPGSGYLYVGQTQTAVTSFLMNALFIIASYQFFQHHMPAAGIITAGFEVGWYVGGIRGAGLAAEQYNNVLYSRLAKEKLVNDNLLPILQLQYGF